MDGLESWTRWTNFEYSCVMSWQSCRSLLAPQILGPFRRLETAISSFYKRLTGAIQSHPTHQWKVCNGLQIVFFNVFGVFWSIFLISTFPNWEPSVYIWQLEAIGAISGEVLGSLAISETCSVAELKRLLTVAHHWPGAVPWTVGDWKLIEIREWYKYNI